MKRITITLISFLLVILLLLVSIGSGKVFQLGSNNDVRGGMIEMAILIFCISIIGLYWVIKKNKNE